ncbi:Eukaryotic translation initiation factor 3 subunit D [Phytophthora boehmeriae]|uniref:Eukaryotic translation initiation factor 3 subunit D n=1 Tax=Phytophthora boehmeriae TaxID=109152 RepID=A0A8T1VUT6_9STRA|nr:Eukaryotic translation initiation factor 3 subunit D [Phytophthora boehmeriae]
MASYETPRVDVNANGWGPTTLPEQFLNVPYAPFNKGDKLGKAADFVSNYAPRGSRYARDPSGVNAEFQYKHDSKEDASFQLVDTAKGTRPKTEDRLRPTWNQQRFGGRGGRGAGRGGRGGLGDKPDPNAATTSSAQLRMKGMQKQNKRWDRLSNARRQFAFRRRDEVHIDRVASVMVQSSWTLIEQFEMQQLTKLQTNIPKTEDLKWCGELREYDATFDRLTSRSNKRVHRYDDRDFYYVTTTDDPVIEELAQQGDATVFATDAILSHLMACTRSVFPWDIVAQRVNNMVFFDKRDESNFDLLSVNENASEPPNQEDPEHMNHPDRLSLEATMINQNLSQQVLKSGNGAFYKKFDDANPFASNDAKPASGAYRYRKFDLGGLNVVARCEVQGVALKKGTQQYVSTFALNEYDPKFPGAIEWRKKIDSQRGAILANELKNNSCKLAKWTAQALLGGVDEMKLGYVSRSNFKDPYSHVVLGMQSYNPNTFATQIALNQNNTWGIIKMLSELLLEQPEGKYVIMKDPNKPILRLFSVPLDTFEEEGEDDEDEDDE